MRERGFGGSDLDLAAELDDPVRRDAENSVASSAMPSAA